MGSPLSLLVVDISENLEEILKWRENGYVFKTDADGRYVMGQIESWGLVPIGYPCGSLRTGLNVIVDTVRVAFRHGIPICAVTFESEGHLAPSLTPYVPEANRYRKSMYSAFSCGLAQRLVDDGCRRLMVIGYDRDICVFETVKDAVSRGLETVTSEHLTLTQDNYGLRGSSLRFFFEHTTFLASIADAWNFLRESAQT